MTRKKNTKSIPGGLYETFCLYLQKFLVKNSFDSEQIPKLGLYFNTIFHCLCPMTKVNFEKVIRFFSYLINSLINMIFTVISPDYFLTVDAILPKNQNTTNCLVNISQSHKSQ